MIIAIDYDETVENDEGYFSKLIDLSRDFGHSICVVTNNHTNSRRDIEDFCTENNVPLFYAGQPNKDLYMIMRGINVDVWVGDSPRSIAGIGESR